MITPTSPGRALRRADFVSLIEALDYAAQGETGLNFHGLRGELVEALTYRDLQAAARALAARLLATGLRPGDRVGLIAETDGDFARAFFACQYAGLVPAPLPLPAPLGGRANYIEQMARMLDAADADALLGPQAMAAWVNDIATVRPLRFAGALAELPQASHQVLPEITPDSPCYLQFSSGSTRFPTGVLVTHRALMANALAITRDGLQVQAQDRAFSWLPLYHDMGLVGFLLSPLTAQMSADLMPTGAFVRRPLLWLDLMGRNGATISYSPTFGYELCARRAENASLEAYDLSRWRIAGLGGDMIRTKPLRDFAERFSATGFSPKAYVASYGMAEATLALTMAPLGRGLVAEHLDVDRLERDGVAVCGAPSTRAREFARCGPPLPGHELQVLGEQGEPLPERRTGRVFARGPSLMSGYFQDSAATSRALTADGWLDTGDIGYLSDGEIVLTGRSKDLIILNGRNIWPQDLEWTAEAEIAGLRSGDVAAFSVPADGEETVVVLVQSRSSDAEARYRLALEITDLLRQRHGVEAQVTLVGGHALPQTSSGKLSRSRAKANYLAGLAETELA
ncbi:fatty acyl-AMP ligase [Phenylobacterium sp.]|uniref:fatty acyl-AMP ligase n=1 Tax=Phenylobacterium sp. TaxID=1871053 RepID=UPI0027308428|nr:fatty acyl-AMP ligase [Phenylobacterium sp.]MDP1618449.1 fatty acyl-AMP ligase [Phenylobacterium sp.]MDP1988058.1 fatty acyl-AMP ligase [Phenylobacterium sp.]